MLVKAGRAVGVGGLDTAQEILRPRRLGSTSSSCRCCRSATRRRRRRRTARRRGEVEDGQSSVMGTPSPSRGVAEARSDVAADDAALNEGVGAVGAVAGEGPAVSSGIFVHAASVAAVAVVVVEVGSPVPWWSMSTTRALRRRSCAVRVVATRAPAPPRARDRPRSTSAPRARHRTGQELESRSDLHPSCRQDARPAFTQPESRARSRQEAPPSPRPNRRSASAQVAEVRLFVTLRRLEVTARGTEEVGKVAGRGSGSVSEADQPATPGDPTARHRSPPAPVAIEDGLSIPPLLLRLVHVHLDDEVIAGALAGTQWRGVRRHQ